MGMKAPRRRRCSLLFVDRIYTGNSLCDTYFLWRYNVACLNKDKNISWKIYLLFGLTKYPSTSNDRSLSCPIIYTDTIHNTILFIDTSTMLDITTDGKTDRCGSCYMSLCAICFAAPLVAVRLNYKFVTKSCVFTDHFNQSNFHFCDNTNGLIYFKYIILMP